MTFDESQIIGSLAELDAVTTPATGAAAGKTMLRLDQYARRYIGLSPFCCLATSDAKGRADVTPRGDKPGFVRVLDDNTLLIPDRPGNRIADTLTNLLADPRIALLFLIPGVGDSFRVNGRATVVDDAELLESSAVDGKPPRLGIVVEIEEAYTQCSKALIRSDLWNPERHVDRSDLPSSGAILRSISDPELDVEEYEAARAQRYARREGLY